MTNIDDKTQDSPEEQIRQLQKERNRLQRMVKRHETQMQQLDKMASANEKVNINLYKELEVLSQQAEVQAREAQIEVALERVRARTMGMHKSDELSEVVVEVFEQLKQVGLDVRECEIIIFDKETLGMELWGSGFTETKLHDSFRIPYLDHPVHKKRIDAWQQGVPYRVVELAGKEKQSFDRVYFEETDFKQLPEATKADIMAVDRFIISEAFTKHGLLETISDSPLPDDQAAILQRFAKVFEQTYTRFLDLQKAEAQAREAQIEAALERVRARTMAMHHSDELHQAAAVLYEQFYQLGVTPFSCGYVINDDEKSEWKVWMTTPNENAFMDFWTVPMEADPILKSRYESWKNKEAFHYSLLEGEENLEHCKVISKYAPWGEEVLEDLPPRLVLNSAHFSHGHLSVVSPERLTSELEQALCRFAKVFEQTYRRFLDLQKAEAQAREAQIEAALERVRAKSMAMHRTDELNEVVGVIFEELKQIGFGPTLCSIGIYDKETKGADWWSYIAGHDLPGAYHFPYLNGRWFKEVYEAWIQQKPYHFIELHGEEMDEHTRLSFEETEWRTLPSHAKSAIIDLSKEGLKASYISMKKGMLEITTQEPLTKDQIQLLGRFTKVIDLTYTRVDDLEQAEEQAREAQIEVALERVRARTMAMHQSSELSEAGNMVFQQIKHLGIHAVTSWFWFIDLDNDSIEIWTTHENKLAESVKVKTSDYFTFQRELEAWKNHESYYKLTIPKQDAIKTIQDIFGIDIGNKDEATHFHLLQTRHKYGFLGLGTWCEATEEEMKISARFASVFEQTYTRFLDLQKAEAQAREAQIEAAIERVRSRSMAMHKSEELNEVVSELYQQIQSLEFSDYGCTIIICKLESEVMEHWYAGEDQVLSRQCYDVPLTNQSVSQKQWNSWLEGVPEFKIYLMGQDKAEYTEFMLNETDHKNLTEDVKEAWRAPEDIYFYYVIMEYGLLEFVNVEPFDEENFPVYRRFAKVFEQTYTRFLDLQKAEAQAREAQIEAALERVRARSMAMHQSEELHEVILVVFEQLESLGIDVDAGFIDVHVKDTKDHFLWVAATGQQYNKQVHLPYMNHPFFTRYAKALKNGESLLTDTMTFAQKERFLDHFYAHAEFTVPKARKAYIAASKGIARSTFLSKNTSLTIWNYKVIPYSSDENDILKRFGHVFAQTYTRFLDLQKAEEQAHKAQIEVSLERVRASTMAMHQSDDVASATVVLFDELNGLGVTSLRCGIAIPLDSKTIEFWAATSTDEGKSVRVVGKDPLNLHHALQKAYDVWKAQKASYTYTLQGKDLTDYYRAVFPTMPIPEWQDRMRSVRGGREEFSTFCFSDGWIYIFTSEPLSNDEMNILFRFTQVFDLTYRRYLDLKQAEEQAREAQIEVSVERVRAKALAMHHSSEILSVAIAIRKELLELGVEGVSAATIYIEQEDGRIGLWDITEVEDTDTDNKLLLDLIFDPKLMSRDLWFWRVWEPKDDYWVTELDLDDLYACERWLRSVSPSKADEFKPFLDSGELQHLWLTVVPLAKGRLNIDFIVEPPAEMATILPKLGATFDLAYTRFEDLQQAEEQAREAQIEVSLERVRSASMAMHKSEELINVVTVMYGEFTNLGMTQSATAAVVIIDEKKHRQTFWGSQTDTDLLEQFDMPLLGHPILQDRYDAWKRKEPLFLQKLGGKNLREIMEFVLPEDSSSEEENAAKGDMPDPTFFYCGNFSHGYTHIIASEPLGAEQESILRRFTGVFHMSYTRFLDLKQAEEQAREAQIEAALERVRARSMAMHQSEELHDVILVVFEQLKSLDIDVDAGIINVHVKDTKDHFLWAAATGQQYNKQVHLPYMNHPFFTRYSKALKNGESLLTDTMTFAQKERFLDHFYANAEFTVPKARKAYVSASKGIARSTFLSKDTSLTIWNYKVLPYTSDENDIIKRFGHVFVQTYTRFLDLKKAEAQAQEAQIEVALERVRSRTMGMQRSDELGETASILFKQISGLGVQPWSSGFQIWNADEVSTTAWMASPEGEAWKSAWKLPHTEDTFHKQILEARQRGEDFFVFESAGKPLEEVYRYIMTLPGPKEFFNDALNSGFTLPTFQITHCGFFSHGYLMFITLEPHPEVWDIFKRFTKVFEQTYTRFLDLQKAEAQAREAQIEAALERVRAKAMGMHNSDDISDATAIVFSELEKLGIITLRCGIIIIHESKQMDAWTATSTEEEKDARVIGRLDMTIHPALYGVFEAWKKQQPFYSYELVGKDKQKYYEAIERAPDYPKPEQEQDKSSSRQFANAFNFPEGALFAFTQDPLTEETSQILKRFTSVFALTYRRFLDLKKAEEQAQEAQIETALERVRSKSMAMHHSNEIIDVVTETFKQLNTLNLNPDVCAIDIYVEGSKDVRVWTATPDQIYIEVIHIPYIDNPFFNRIYEARVKREKIFSDIISREDKNAFYHHGIDHSILGKLITEKRKKRIFEAGRMNRTCSVLKHSGLLIVNFRDHAFTEKENQIISRFGQVFEQAYTRFLDLQKAEAQARESQIEAALERVRAKAMGMHSSEDLASTVSIVFQELQTLHITPMRCGVGLIDGETRVAEILTTSATKEDHVLELVGTIKLEGHPVVESIFEQWKLQKEYHPVLKGNPLKKYYEFITRYIDIPDWQSINIQHGYFFPFPEGCLYTWAEKEFVEEELRIFRKFTSVLGLTYRRYLDLKEAEARAQEAEQQASVDRVRAEIASMRNADDLNRITPLIWRELTTLSVPFFRCGVFIIDEASEQIHAYMSTPSGKSLAALNLKFGSTPLVEQTVLYWRRRKVYREEWDREQFIKWTQTILSQIDSPKQYQAGEEAPERLALQFVPFTQGMLYVGSATPLADDEIDLIQALADAFAVAYARYEDFTQLEAAKAELEEENQRKARELEEARQLQLSMLPKDVPKLPGLEIAVYMKTATEVGGDYYDFHTSDDGTLTVVVGDATGHGLKAGTMVTAAKTLFSALAKNPDILSTFAEMNTSIKSMKLPLLSMCLAMLKFSNGILKLSSAGIPPVLIYRNAGKRLEELNIDGMPLGAMKGFPYRQETVKLKPEDTILLMSDGFPELMNDKEKMLDYPNAYAAFKNVGGKSPKEIIDHLVKTGTKWANGRPQDDDVTFVVLKVKPFDFAQDKRET